METFLQSKEIKVPKANKVHPSKIDFNFKSSFARSLSYNNNDDYNDSNETSFEIDHRPCNESGELNENENATCDKKLSSVDEDLVVGNFNESFNKSDEIKSKERQLWSKKQINSHSSDAEILRLRKECQLLIEENRRLQSKQPPKMSSLPYGSLQFECTSNVENVVLQTKIETLHWQLKQVENSRQMYRAIMEEVARYLEKCHLNFELLQQRERESTMERSKSIANIAKGKFSDHTQGRAQSSTNLNMLQHQKQQKSGTLLSELSYSAFKDFTWRRTPKNKTSTPAEIKPEKFTFQFEDTSLPANIFETSRPVPEIAIDAEKLSKEAFRLSRTVQNFLNTHEPILSQTNDTTNERPSSVFQRPGSEQQRNDFLFGFDRESHLSLRSTDESSVHSSSNSSNSKEEEEPTILPGPKKSAQPQKSFSKPKKVSSNHQTEDESGFSSMSSFHEVGLPFHSTLLSNISGSSSTSDESQSDTVKFKKPATPIDSKNEVGLPIPKTTINHHRRYDSAPVTTSKMKLLESDEKTMKVLWV